MQGHEKGKSVHWGARRQRKTRTAVFIDLLKIFVKFRSTVTYLIVDAYLQEFFWIVVSGISSAFCFKERAFDMSTDLSEVQGH